jgi:signal peptidase I
MKILTFREFVKIMMTCVAMLVIFQFVLVPTKVVMTSMYPTLDDGQYIIINKFPCGMLDPARGDIIVFWRDSYDNTLIKRVIGLPGECAQYRNDHCYINHKMLEEQTDKSTTDYSQPFPKTMDHDGCIQLGENQYYVLGDNRPVSLDSRAFGPIEKKSIVGKLILKTPFGDR